MKTTRLKDGQPVVTFEPVRKYDERDYDLGYERLRRKREDIVAAIFIVLSVIAIIGCAHLVVDKFGVKSWADFVEFVKAMRYLF